MTSWPILSVVTFLPVVGVLVIYLHAAATTRPRAQCALDRAVDHAGHLRGVADPGLALRCREAGIPVRREARLARRGITYHMGVDGISLPFVILTTALDAALHHRELAVDHRRACANT